MENPFDIEQTKQEYLEVLEERTLKLSDLFGETKTQEANRKAIQKVHNLEGEEYETVLVIRKTAKEAIKYLLENPGPAQEVILEREREEMLESAEYASIRNNDEEETRKHVRNITGPKPKNLEELIRKVQENLRNEISPERSKYELSSVLITYERTIIEIARRVYEKLNPKK